MKGLNPRHQNLLAFLFWIQILPSKWELWPTTLSKIDWCYPCHSFWFYAKTIRYKFYL